MKSEFDWYNLPLEEAKTCLAFLHMVELGELGFEIPEDRRKEYTQFKKELNCFKEYMTITTNSGLSKIGIPERYYRIYNAVGEMAKRLM